ncbi:MAG: hypothetical protein LBQ19_05590 [Synergistaceae bacterium]|jgi:hypothetical protein|nr:hypothetical protein [Synergistaceae bacterium]
MPAVDDLRRLKEAISAINIQAVDLMLAAPLRVWAGPAVLNLWFWDNWV